MASEVEREYDEYRSQGRITGRLPREKFKKLKFPRVSEDIRKRFLAVEDLTSVVADILDGMGIEGAVAASFMRPVLPGTRIVGSAVTIRSIPERKATARGSLDKDPSRMSGYEVFLISEPGDVCVFDCGGNLEASNLGGLACTVAKQCGVAGVVAFGAVRDVAAMREMGFPVWSSGVTPKTGKYRIDAIEVNAPVSVHDVIVQPGDLVVADDNGVAFIPPEHVEAVLKAVEASEASERVLLGKLAGDVSIDDVRAAVGAKPAGKK